MKQKLKDIYEVIFGIIAGISIIFIILFSINMGSIPILKMDCARKAEALHLDYEFLEGRYILVSKCILVLPDGRRSFAEDYKIIDSGSYIDFE